MAKYFISKLQIEGFRGINNENDPLEINLKNDQVNSIFASNAQGKSSIFDALCFAIKGTVPKLGLLQQSERAENYYVNQFHSTASANNSLNLTTR
jgi:DNA repair exonuclease SbcCD ATPase subunit